MPRTSKQSPRNQGRHLLLPDVIHSLQILDTPEEQIYEDAVQLAAQICGAPIALVSLIDHDRQWFKAKYGLDILETSREVSFCAHAILEPSVMVVEDATLDKRFVQNELVTGSFHLRFYAGAPVVANGVAVGTLCVIDKVARVMSQGQIEALEALARQVSASLQLRLVNRDLQNSNEVLEQQNELLAFASSRFANLFHGLPVACITLDADCTVMEWNTKSTSVFGYLPEEAVCRSIYDLVVPEEGRSGFSTILEETIKTGTPTQAHEQVLRRQDGTPIWLLSNIVPVFDKGGVVVGLICSHIDITGRKLAEEALMASSLLIEDQKTDLEALNHRLMNLVRTDGLTGLNNHRSFQEFIEGQFGLAKRHRRKLSLVIGDIDHFKRINDEFGHLEGDQVLIQVAGILQNLLRDGAMVARYGGEEFAIVLPETSELEAVEVAERLRSGILEWVWDKSPMTMSFGVAEIVAGDQSVPDLVRRADEALYHSKRTGRNRTTASNHLMEIEIDHAS